jgi:hypothetical protein
MYIIPYFDELGQHQISPEFPNIQTLVDYINETPTRNHSIILYKNHMVGYTTDCVVLNGKPRRKFINFMLKAKPSIDEYLDEN